MTLAQIFFARSERRQHIRQQRFERMQRSRRAASRQQMYKIEALEKRVLLSATPGLDPVLFVPGFFGTFDADPGDGLDDYLTQRGIAPEELQIDPIGNNYGDIIQTLENVGYVQDENLFIVNWDYRVNAGPADGTSDGQLTGVTGASISDNTFETGLDYLGYYLKKAGDAYAASHDGAVLGEVDIITHSTGGTVARSYIQSTAYGDGLATIDDFVMVASPNQGVSQVFNLLQNDFATESEARLSIRLLGTNVANLAYDLLQSGQTIFGPDGDITDPAISKTDFIDSYTAVLQDLLPTYDFLDTDGDDVLESLTDSGGNLEALGANTNVDPNALLLDLNFGADPNAFVDGTGTTVVVYSTEVDQMEFVELRTGPDAGGFEVDEILNFDEFIGNSPAAGEVWFEDIVTAAGGDGTNSTLSTAGQFFGDARLDGADPSLVLNEITAADAGAVINHVKLVQTLLSQSKILDALGVTGYADSDISTDLTFSPLKSFVLAVQFGLIDPVALFQESVLDASVFLPDLQAGLTDLKAWLGDLDNVASVAAQLPIVDQSIGALLDFSGILTTNIIDPILAFMGGTSPTASGLIAAIEGLGVSAGGLDLVIDIGKTFGGFLPAATGLIEGQQNDELFFNLALTATRTSDPLPVSLGADAAAFGVSVDAGGELTATATANLDLTFGLDLGSGLSAADRFYVSVNDLSVSAALDVNDAGFNVSIGPASLGVSNGEVVLEAGVSVVVNDPNGDGRLTLAEFQATAFADLISFDASGTLDAVLPLTGNLGVGLEDLGSPVVIVHDADLFDGINPDVRVDVDISTLKDTILSALSELKDLGAGFIDLGFLDFNIPGLDISLPDLFDLPDVDFAGLFDLHLPAINYFDLLGAFNFDVNLNLQGIYDLLLARVSGITLPDFASFNIADHLLDIYDLLAAEFPDISLPDFVDFDVSDYMPDLLSLLAVEFPADFDFDLSLHLSQIGKLLGLPDLSLAGFGADLRAAIGDLLGGIPTMDGLLGYLRTVRLDGLLPGFEGSLAFGPLSLTGGYFADAQEVRLDVHLNPSKDFIFDADMESLIDADQLAAFGLSVQAFAVELNAALDLDFSIGLDASDLAGLSSDDVFLRLHNITLDGALSATDLDFGLDFGGRARGCRTGRSTSCWGWTSR